VLNVIAQISERMKNLVLFLVVVLSVKSVAAQESGRYNKKTPIPKRTISTPPQSKKNDDFLPPLRIKNDFENVRQETLPETTHGHFEPRRELNPTISAFDTTSVDEGELRPVEVIESVKINGADDVAMVATYYSIWSSKNIDPYGINIKKFEGVVDIELYNESLGYRWASPLNAPKITSNFGPRWRRLHAGVDLDLDTGDPVHTTFDGIVRVSGYDGRGYGKYLVVRHYNGIETVYGHLSAKNYESGNFVKAGDVIGKGGSTGHSTGSHLHYETRYEGKAFNPTYVFNFAGKDTKPVDQHVLISARVFDTYGEILPNEFNENVENEEEITTTTWVTIRAGDTLGSIANLANISIQQLAKMNGISTSTRLKVGRRLRIN
jgi:LysM repeat protein